MWLSLGIFFFLPESNLELSPTGGEDGEQEDVVGEGDEAVLAQLPESQTSSVALIDTNFTTSL
jgi:hypothetical protein